MSSILYNILPNNVENTMNIAETALKFFAPYNSHIHIGTSPASAFPCARLGTALPDVRPALAVTMGLLASSGLVRPHVRTAACTENASKKSWHYL